eukprot:TRINITY_DN2036_c0_g1_i11.p1 TRINITY_DN2036_c0_g1~~TRINITY_DN2036_c0_g1_i11.p1  ORF type:complete len:179 (-),score=50.36 TRINITY_DN2036_c0_g1_i11:15-551(-)
MIILIELSVDLQFYEGQMTLQPTHSKDWYKRYKYFFWIDIILAVVILISTFLAYKLRVALRDQCLKFSTPENKGIKFTGLNGNLAQSFLDDSMDRLPSPMNQKSNPQEHNDNNNGKSNVPIEKTDQSKASETMYAETNGKHNILNTPPSYVHSKLKSCLLYTSPSPRDGLLSRMPSSA